MTLISILTVYTLFAAAAIISRYTSFKAYTITKGLPVSFLVVLLAVGGDPQWPWFWYGLLALLFGLLGDLFLLSDRFFLAGLISFLTGHVFFGLTFYSSSFVLPFWFVVPLALGAGIYSREIAASAREKGKGAYSLPVILYTAVITVMVLVVLNFCSLADSYPLALALACVLFYFSDSILAWNKFYRSFKAAQFLILTTYFSAQLLFFLTMTGATAGLH